MRVIMAPFPYQRLDGELIVFLAGSIETGTSVQWRNKVIDACRDDNVLFLNPSRDDWDSTWQEHIDNPQFNEQVTWELVGLETADLIFLYFDSTSKGPLSLLEFGLFHTHNMLVCCPPGYWRKGNVDIVCKRYDLTEVACLEDAINQMKKWFGNRFLDRGVDHE